MHGFSNLCVFLFYSSVVVSSVAATAVSCMFFSVALAAAISTSSSVTSSKPAFSYVTLYVPASTPSSAYSPFSSVNDVVYTVSAAIIDTCAPSIAASSASYTFPVSLPVVDRFEAFITGLKLNPFIPAGELVFPCRINDLLTTKSSSSSDVRPPFTSIEGSMNILMPVCDPLGTFSSNSCSMFFIFMLAVVTYSLIRSYDPVSISRSTRLAVTPFVRSSRLKVFSSSDSMMNLSSSVSPLLRISILLIVTFAFSTMSVGNGASVSCMLSFPFVPFVLSSLLHANRLVATMMISAISLLFPIILNFNLVISCV